MAIWLDLVGFGWIWLDLVGFGWIWLDQGGFWFDWIQGRPRSVLCTAFLYNDHY